MKSNNVTKFIEVEIGITEDEYKILKSISWIDVYSTIDSQKADVVVKELIDLIINTIEYTGKENYKKWIS